MTAKDLLAFAVQLNFYLASFDELFGRSETREHFRCFARGQLSSIERKSLVSVRKSPSQIGGGLPGRHVVAGVQRCGSRSSIWLAG